jgi:hypothetical protein
MQPHIKQLGQDLWEMFVPEWLKNFVEGSKAMIKDPFGMIGTAVGSMGEWIYNQFKYDWIEPTLNYFKQLPAAIRAQLPGGDKNFKFKDYEAPAGAKISKSFLEYLSDNMGKEVEKTLKPHNLLTQGMLSNVTSYAPLMTKYAKENNLTADQATKLLGMMAQESSGNLLATNKNARGLYQMMPDYEKDAEKLLGRDINPFNPEDAIAATTKMFKIAYDKYLTQGFDAQKATELAIREHNYGPGNMQKYLSGTGGYDITQPVDRQYVAKVNNFAEQLGNFADNIPEKTVVSQGVEAQQIKQTMEQMKKELLMPGSAESAWNGVLMKLDELKTEMHTNNTITANQQIQQKTTIVANSKK